MFDNQTETELTEIGWSLANVGYTGRTCDEIMAAIRFRLDHELAANPDLDITNTARAFMLGTLATLANDPLLGPTRAVASLTNVDTPLSVPTGKLPPVPVINRHRRTMTEADRARMLAAEVKRARKAAKWRERGAL